MCWTDIVRIAFIIQNVSHQVSGGSIISEFGLSPSSHIPDLDNCSVHFNDQTGFQNSTGSALPLLSSPAPAITHEDKFQWLTTPILAFTGIRFNTQPGIFQLKLSLLLMSFFRINHALTIDNMTTLPVLLSGSDTGKTTFVLPGHNLNLVYSVDGLVLYESQLETNRQIKAVTKWIDFGALSVANHNSIASLKFLSNHNQMAENNHFMLINGYEFIISDKNLRFEECSIYCASKQATMIDDTRYFYPLASRFQFDELWIKTVTNVTMFQNHPKYEAYLGTTMVFPTNYLSAKRKVRIFHHNNNRREEILVINELYEYYDPQLLRYWVKNPYSLHASVTPYGTVQIYLPESPLHHVGQSYRHKCGCYREPLESATLFHSLKMSRNALILQQQDIQIGLEPARTNIENPQAGSLPNIIYPFLNSDPIVKKKRMLDAEIFFNLRDIHPLITNQTKSDLSSSLVFLTATHIGKPLVVGLLQPKLEHMAKKLGAKLFNLSKQNTDFTHDFIEISGLSFRKDNMSLILNFNNLHAFTKNITSDLITTNMLIKNLTLTNTHFSAFLKNEAEKILIGMAANSMDTRIDTERPVLGVVNRHLSFLAITFYFSTYSEDFSSTKYNAISIPIRSVDDELYAIDVPQQFMSKVGQVGYQFVNTQNVPTLINACANSFLGTYPYNMLEFCGKKFFPDTRLQIILKLGDQRLFLARGKYAIIKIMCYTKPQQIHNMKYDILVFLVHKSCDVHFVSKQGIISMAANYTILDNSKHTTTKLLIHYNIVNAASTDYWQTVTISILGAIIGIFILMLSLVAYYVVTRKVSAQLSSETLTRTIDPANQMEDQFQLEMDSVDESKRIAHSSV